MALRRTLAAHDRWRTHSKPEIKRKISTDDRDEDVRRSYADAQYVNCVPGRLKDSTKTRLTMLVGTGLFEKPAEPMGKRCIHIDLHHRLLVQIESPVMLDISISDGPYIIKFEKCPVPFQFAARSIAWLIHVYDSIFAATMASALRNIIDDAASMEPRMPKIVAMTLVVEWHAFFKSRNPAMGIALDMVKSEVDTFMECDDVVANIHSLDPWYAVVLARRFIRHVPDKLRFVTPKLPMDFTIRSASASIGVVMACAALLCEPNGVDVSQVCRDATEFLGKFRMVGGAFEYFIRHDLHKFRARERIMPGTCPDGTPRLSSFHVTLVDNEVLVPTMFTFHPIPRIVAVSIPVWAKPATDPIFGLDVIIYEDEGGEPYVSHVDLDPVPPLVSDEVVSWMMDVSMHVDEDNVFDMETRVALSVTFCRADKM
jgi:hypothetical protein